MLPAIKNCPAGDLDCSGWYKSKYNICGYAENRAILLKEIFKDSTNAPTDFAPPQYGDNSIITADGMVYSIHDCYSYIYVDTNGVQKPNKHGRDRFLFYIADENKNGVSIGTVIPMGSSLNAIYDDYQLRYWKNNNDCNGTNWDPYNGCAGRVLEEDAMNY